MVSLILFWAVLFVLAACIGGFCIAYWVYSPFRPYARLVIDIDVTNRRKVFLEDEIEQYIIDNGFDEFRRQEAMVSRWRTACLSVVDASLFSGRRFEQFDDLDASLMPVEFRLIRRHTRYRQVNYERMPYIVKDVSQDRMCDFKYLRHRYNALKAIGFETTTRKYRSCRQRSLMTRKLREQIMRRDNYTCQICGKYMPDRVGLQIDHKIPVARGGKTIPSNLQVLCSRCNLSKGDRFR